MLCSALQQHFPTSLVHFIRLSATEGLEWRIHIQLRNTGQEYQVEKSQQLIIKIQTQCHRSATTKPTLPTSLLQISWKLDHEQCKNTTPIIPISPLPIFKTEIADIVDLIICRRPYSPLSDTSVEQVYAGSSEPQLSSPDLSQIGSGR